MDDARDLPVLCAHWKLDGQDQAELLHGNSNALDVGRRARVGCHPPACGEDLVPWGSCRRGDHRVRSSNLDIDCWIFDSGVVSRLSVLGDLSQAEPLGRERSSRLASSFS